MEWKLSLLPLSFPLMILLSHESDYFHFKIIILLRFQFSKISVFEESMYKVNAKKKKCKICQFYHQPITLPLTLNHNPQIKKCLTFSCLGFSSGYFPSYIIFIYYVLTLLFDV